eukprot:3141250-Rhodomonas_salina.1
MCIRDSLLSTPSLSSAQGGGRLADKKQQRKDEGEGEGECAGEGEEEGEEGEGEGGPRGCVAGGRR